MQLSLIANSSTQTFTLSLAGLFAETTRQELANFAAALGGSERGDEDAELPGYLTVSRDERGVTVTEAWPMSLRMSDDVNETAELTLAQAQQVSAWLTGQITTPHLGLQTLECQAD